MGASERAAALRRARERQARIEAATAQAVAAQGGVQRAVDMKVQAVERCDERIAVAEQTFEATTAYLAKVCGSVEVAAEILGLSQREVRRVMKAERERRALRPTDSGAKVQ